MLTGGGAYNTFLLGELKESITQEVIVPEKQIIDFKEALIFAFLGVLRLRGENNCLKSVTGSIRDNCGGVLYDTY